MSRCTGHCCERFHVDVDVLTDPARDVEDGAYIADMLVPLGEPDPEAPHRWPCTCRHFDGRNCTAYVSRPRMCSRYPYGRACTYAACTLLQVDPVPVSSA